MKMSMNQPESARPEWSAEEVALAGGLRSGMPLEDRAPLPDPDAIFLLAEVLGSEPPRPALPVRILTSWALLAALGSLPVALWVARRWEEWGLASSLTLESSVLISTGKALADAGTPGWETGVLFLGAFLYLTFEYALDRSRRI